MKHVLNSAHTMKTRFNCAALLISVVLFTVLSMSPASAAGKKVDGISIENLLALSLCRASADPDNIRGDINTSWDGKDTCCSKKEDSCIFCEPDGSCTKTDYSKRPDRFQKPTLTAPTDRVIAPVKPKRLTAKGTQKTTPRELKSN